MESEIFTPTTTQFGHAMLASFAAGMGTGLGSLAVVGIRRLSQTMEEILLSAAAGVMLAASFFALLIPAMEHARQIYPEGGMPLLLVLGGIALGALLLLSLHSIVPHEHPHSGREGPQTLKVKRLWLFIFAITLHNLPEGMAVGVGFMQSDQGAGLSLALGIGLQNIPEGLAVSVSLLSIGYGRVAAIFWGSVTGLVEPLGGLIGAGAVWLIASLLPLFLALAAGAMLYVISDEIIPETHRAHGSTHSTIALLGGLMLMVALQEML